MSTMNTFVNARWLALSCAAAASLAACGGSQSSIAPATVATASTMQKVVFKIDAPSSSASTSRRVNYVSPATTQLAVDIRQNGASISGYPTTVALTPTSTGCTSTLANLVCELAVSLPAGSYTASLTAQDANGAVLSTAQTLSFTVVAGTNNLVPLTLSGVPKSIVASLLSASSGAVLVNALDADNNIIVGAGAPSFSVAQTGGVSLTLTQPTTTAPNVFTMVGATGGNAALTVTAAYPGSATNACTQTGAVCSTPLTATVSIPTGSLFVANAGVGNVSIFSGLTETGSIVNGLSGPDAVTADANNDVFVLNDWSNTVVEYASPYAAGSLVQTISNVGGGPSGPNGLVLDGKGNLFVSNYGSPSEIQEFSVATGALENTFAVNGNPGGLAIDSAGNLFVPEGTQGMVELTAASSYIGSTAVTLTTQPMSALAAVAFNNGNMFVADYNNNCVYEYAGPSFGGSPVVTLSASLDRPDALAFDGSGNLYVANDAANTITSYKSPYSGAPDLLTSITFGLSNPEGIAFPPATGTTYAITP
jgi:sugar lactone lactonase YvrE